MTEDFRRLTRKGKFLGAGSFKKTYEHPTNREKVVKINDIDPQHPELVRHMNSPEAMKADFFLNRIAQILFPNRVAPIHLVTSNPGMQIQRRVEGTRPDESRQEEVESIAAQFEMVGLEMDSGLDNFIEEKGRLIYIDDFIIRDDMIPRLKRAVDTLPDGMPKARAQGYLRRLGKLT